LKVKYAAWKAKKKEAKDKKLFKDGAEPTSDRVGVNPEPVEANPEAEKIVKELRKQN
jgi:hypothetical protein